MRNSGPQFQPRRSLAQGQIIAIEACFSSVTNIGSWDLPATKDEIRQEIEAALGELFTWQRGSLHGIPLNINLPSAYWNGSELITLITHFCDERSLARSLVEVTVGLSSPGKYDPDLLNRLKGEGFHTGLYIASSDSIPQGCAEILCGTLDIQLPALTEASTDENLLAPFKYLLETARISGVETVARGIQNIAEYNFIVKSGLFSAGIGPFFWSPQSSSELLRNELNLSRIFAQGWHIRKGRFIPNNPLYFHPWTWC